jgi:hypothetical protein
MTCESENFLFPIITKYSDTVERYHDRSAAEFPSFSLHFHLRLKQYMQRKMNVLYLAKNIFLLKLDRIMRQSAVLSHNYETVRRAVT